MSQIFDDIEVVAKKLQQQMEGMETRTDILKSSELKELLSSIKHQPIDQRADYGKAVNQLKQRLADLASQKTSSTEELEPVDLSAPYDLNVPKDRRPRLLGPEQGAVHPITQELNKIKDIFIRMGFTVHDSRQIDNDYNMFEALNFPIDHPARDDYDTFTTEEGLVLPAHTSTMQNRILSKIKPPIRAVIPGRVFRNEDVDVTHEHTFYQVEGLLVDKDINLGHMLGTLKTFLESYFEQKIEYKTQPFYFPFVEPGLEYLIKMPKVLNTSSDEQWLEILGCGMIHPNVLKEAGVDSNQYSGFAWGMGLDRMVMLKYGIDDIRHFHSSRLEFLSKFGLGL
jgi:phenylalanyl-tRNA synthetase alpha chain